MVALSLSQRILRGREKNEGAKEGIATNFGRLVLLVLRDVWEGTLSLVGLKGTQQGRPAVLGVLLNFDTFSHMRRAARPTPVWRSGSARRDAGSAGTARKSSAAHPPGDMRSAAHRSRETSAHVGTW